jgi:hypothetical protein
MKRILTAKITPITEFTTIFTEKKRFKNNIGQ